MRSSAHLGPLFRRQFLFSNESVDDAVPPEFVHLQLPAGHLYHSQDLRVRHLSDASGHPWCLLGEAVDVLTGTDVGEVLSSTSCEDVGSLFGSLDGRWLLIGDHQVHGDMQYLIPVFYAHGSCASTPSLLPSYRAPRPRLDIVDVMDWFPAPLSGVPGVKRLLPSQVLDVRDFSVASRPLPLAESLTVEDSLAQMRRYLRNSIAGLTAERVVVPLTAGWDSRLVLAASVDAGVPVQCVTLAHPGMSVADREVPPQLADAVGADHRFILPGRVDRRARRLYDHQVGGHIREMDRRFMYRSQYAWTREGDVLLRGLSLDITRQHFHRDVPREQPELDDLRALLNPTAMQMDGLRAYEEWLRLDPQPLSFDLRFDLEQGNSAWAAMSGVVLDLTAASALQPGNTGVYLSAALGLPEEMRTESEHHVRIIEAVHAPLLDFPVNPPEPRWRPRRVRAAVLRRGTTARRSVELHRARCAGASAS
ncbi:MAG: hypothetical protein WA892_02275 [Ornithinimicrobium sp.]